MKRIFVLMMVMFLVFSGLKAQDYKTGVGVRAGFSTGLSIKHFQNHKAAIEGLLTTRWEGFQVTGLYEIHHQAFDVRRLNWYYGVGAHIGFYNGTHTYWGRNDYTYTIVGIDGVLGIEYNFEELPINIGIDWKPAFNLVGYTGIWSEGALSIRYIF